MEKEQKTAPVEQVKPAPFNPFLTLNSEELTALVSSFNKQWKASNALNIALAQTEHSCSENDAIFVAWLKSEASSVLDRNAVTDSVKFISNMLPGVAFTQSETVTLGLIEGSYSALKVELRKTVGIRVRDYALGKWTQSSAQAILEKVYKHLKISEKDWMRA